MSKNKYLIRNDHPAIIDRNSFERVQVEMAKRVGTRSDATQAITGMAKFSGMYALTGRVTCGECGKTYKRITWAHHGTKKIVWRCISRVEYGKKYCHESPSVPEDALKEAILKAVNSLMSDHEKLIESISTAMSRQFGPMSNSGELESIDAQLKELEQETARLVKESGGDISSYQDQFREVMNQAAMLKKRRTAIVDKQNNNEEEQQKLEAAMGELINISSEMKEWDETMIRQLVQEVTILSKSRIRVTIIGGGEIEQNVE